MEIKNVSANQIITSSHKKLHNIHILKIYYKIYAENKASILPPSPVLYKDTLLKKLPDNLKEIFLKFLKQNPKVKYVLLDGSHKTTAADLNNKKCKIMILKNHSYIKKAIQMEKSGEIFQYRLGKTMNELTNELITHFNSKKFFQTIPMKTNYLVKNKLLPKYMLNN